MEAFVVAKIVSREPNGDVVVVRRDPGLKAPAPMRVTPRSVCHPEDSREYTAVAVFRMRGCDEGPRLVGGVRLIRALHFLAHSLTVHSQLGPPIRRSSSLAIKWEDMVRMEDVNSATILHNLRIRFKDGDIYTNIGKILVSINPFKWETSEVFYNDEWVSVFRAADPENPIPYVPASHHATCVRVFVASALAWRRQRVRDVCECMFVHTCM